MVFWYPLPSIQHPLEDPIFHLNFIKFKSTVHRIQKPQNPYKMLAVMIVIHGVKWDPPPQKRPKIKKGFHWGEKTCLQGSQVIIPFHNSSMGLALYHEPRLFSPKPAPATFTHPTHPYHPPSTGPSTSRIASACKPLAICLW